MCIYFFDIYKFDKTTYFIITTKHQVGLGLTSFWANSLGGIELVRRGLIMDN